MFQYERDIRVFLIFGVTVSQDNAITKNWDFSSLFILKWAGYAVIKYFLSLIFIPVGNLLKSFNKCSEFRYAVYLGLKNRV